MGRPKGRGPQRGKADVRGPLLVVLLALLACGEAYPYVDVQVRFPGAAALDEKKLAVEMDLSGAATPKWETTWFEAKKLRDGFDLHMATRIGPTQKVRLRAWYDTNANGKRDRGDFVGDSGPTPFVARDRGLLRGNDNRASDITMVAVP